MDYQQKEALKQKVQIAGVSFVAGGLAWWLVLAGGFGWVSAGTAQQRTGDAVQTKVDQVLAPFCADRVMADKTAMAKFVKAKEDYDRDEVVQKAIPKLGSTEVDYQLSDACASAIRARLKSAAKSPAPSAAKKG